MKKIFKTCFLLMTLFAFPIIIKANSIDKIDMDIYVDKEGTAHVTETWSANLNQGTEGYKPYYNIGDAKITNFKVSEEDREYTYTDNWNTNLSFEEKAHKNGINYVDNGLELCWGISKYGYHNYVLTYDIEGFVVKLNDSDMIYWSLIPNNLSSKPGDVHIKIYSDAYFSDNVPVWGYGKKGATAYVYNGYIEMNSEGTLNSDEYMVILAKFDSGTFDTQNTINHDFKYYQDMAKKGSTPYKKSFFSKIFSFIISMISIIFPIIMIILGFGGALIGIRKSGRTVGSKELDFGQRGRVLPKDVPNMRDIPFNKNIFRAFWIAEAYRIDNKKTDFLGAILLKWILEKKIILRKDEVKKLFKTSEESVIELPDDTTFDNDLEGKLFKMMKEASHDGVLESREFEKWSKTNYNRILSWFDDVIDEETEKLKNEGKVTYTEKTTFKVFKSYIYVVNQSMMDDAIKLKGLKNFLEEFSRIDDKEAIEVNMWEYYLIFAQILGIADKVAKQFKKLYPEIIESNEYGYTYNDFVFINMMSYSSMSSAISSKSRAESYSSGGGGFSSGGGGGGSFGSGGGGGGFR